MKLLQTIKCDFLEILPPAIFFLIAFSLIQVTKRLILSEYGISWTGFGSAVVGAFMIGKVVLIVDKLPIVNRFHDRRLICNTFWKSLIYFLAALLLQYLEPLVHSLIKHESLIEANRHFMTETVWPHFWLIQIWLAVLLLVYCAMRELVRAVGEERVVQMFFSSRSDPE
jgi:Ni/Fe-hydrogenase subunit HybB-like protein